MRRGESLQSGVDDRRHVQETTVDELVAHEFPSGCNQKHQRDERRRGAMQVANGIAIMRRDSAQPAARSMMRVFVVVEQIPVPHVVKNREGHHRPPEHGILQQARDEQATSREDHQRHLQAGDTAP